MLSRVWLRCAPVTVMAAASMAWAGPVGPVAYRSFADSPFNGLALPGFQLEDFEDGLGNTPGLLLDARYVRAPGGLTDSVDSDDGAIDGDGRGGFSYSNDSGYGRTSRSTSACSEPIRHTSGSS